MIDDRGDAATRPGLALPSGVEPASAVSSTAAIPVAELAELACVVAAARCMEANCGRWHPRHKRCATCPQNVGDEIARVLLKDLDWWMSRYRLPDFANPSELPNVARLTAQGIEARQGGDASCGSVHESPTPRSGDAPEHLGEPKLSFDETSDLNAVVRKHFGVDAPKGDEG